MLIGNIAMISANVISINEIISDIPIKIQEELDTEIEVGELLDTIEYDYPTFHLSMKCFWSSIVSGDLVLKEHEAARQDLFGRAQAELPALRRIAGNESCKGIF